MNDSDSLSKFQVKDIAIRKYAAVLGYMQYEGSTYWVRAQHFLVANSLLVGLVLPHLPASKDKLFVPQLLILLVASLAGIALTWLWLQALASGQYWLSHWQSALQTLEAAAYDDLLLHRDFPPKPGRISATKIAKQTAYLFMSIWAISLIYVLVSAVVIFTVC